MAVAKPASNAHQKLATFGQIPRKSLGVVCAGGD
jgi:hypothetical protein